MKPGIDPKVDYAFKKVFGSESNADLLQDLLAAVLGFAVSAVEIINPFNEKETPDDKLSVLDIKATDAAGQWFDVEMQMFSHEAIIPRLLYYWARLYTGQIREGESFATLRPAYSVCFLNSRLFHRRPDVYLNHFRALDSNTGEELTSQFSFHIVELPKFTTRVEDVATPLERWCYFFRHGASLDADALPPTLDTPPIRKAMEVLVRMSQTEAERARYESRDKFRRDMQQIEIDRQAAMAALQASRASEATLRASEATLRASEATLRASEATLRANAVEASVGQIHFCQRLLEQPLTPQGELGAKTLEDLQRLAAELQRQVISGTEDGHDTRRDT
jgi:predicted transposase/invertase (TIGR01784 family)